MKLAISNIAWRADEDAAALPMLRDLGVAGLEVAPTRLWPDLYAVTSDDLAAARQDVEAQGLRVVALQSLLFGRPDLQVFGDEATQDALLAHLDRVMAIGAALGAGPLVFGSPRNRTRGDTPMAVAMEQAVALYGKWGEAAAFHGVCLCIEPNAPAYGCDFITTVAEAIELVRLVDHPGFRLHVDAGVMTLNGEDYASTLEAAFPYMAHYHVSEPNLVLVGEGGTDHARAADCLRSLGYDGWVSIEMRTSAPPDGDNLPGVRRSVERALAAYGD